MDAILRWTVIALAVLGAFVLISSIVSGVLARLRSDEDEWDLDGDESPAGVARDAAAELELEFDWWEMTPDTLEAQSAFLRGVAALSNEDTPVSIVVPLTRDSSGWVASMALAALSERDDVPEEWVRWATRNPARPSNCEDTMLLRALARHATAPVIASIVPLLDSVRDELIADFVRRRREGGERIEASTFQQLTLEQAEQVEAFVSRFEDELGPEFRAGFEEWRAIRNLTTAGRVWERPFDSPPALLAGRRRDLVELVVTALHQTPPRSVLLVGEHGVGKTMLARAALERLRGDTVVFETTAAQLIAGAVFVGELEGRVKTMVDSLQGQPVVWVLPELQEALFAGQHSRSPQGLLDALLPHIESGRITLVAEVTPTAAELLTSARPRVESAFETVRVRPLDEVDSIEVARHALQQDTLEVTTDDETLAESYELAQHFLPGVAPPGNLIRLLHATAAEAAEQGAGTFSTPDVLATLAAGSGLPLAVLDPGTPLPLEDVRAFFERRVLDQPEAVDCIVERIAMIKAGVTDPSRPLGVFLFVGPTGTGKTEIAKALAEFLFGSAERLVRLDMSEYQTPEALERLLSDTATEPHAAALISSIRTEPFAVILLDEFEKAAQPIWDIFLQVFDDGRLTDLQGRVVDFRRTVIVLTSNLGSPLAHAPSVGFEPSHSSFTSAGVERAVRASFRPEFLNRLDRIVVFRPFERSAMRALLDKELAEALARRGLRDRPWAVEIDESAYSFLIDRGFSPELGARPLKRALERYLLAPLATAIVEQSVPDGDQFLFVTAFGGDRIDVAFVDPDEEPRTEEKGADEPAALDMRTIARSSRGDADSVRFVLSELARVSDAVEKIQERKAQALAAISEPGFWDRSDRFAVLSETEYLDRLTAATRTAERLGARLSHSTRPDGRANGDLVELLAGRLHVLGAALAGIAAGAPTDVFVHVRVSGTDRGGEAEPFAALLTEMYVGWAERRGMHFERLDAPAGEHLLAVSGLGCSEILGGESGVHVLEQVDERDGDRVVDREHVRVLVLPRPQGPDAGPASRARLARHAVDEAEKSTLVIRRYRPGKAPLVRDSARGYRTGRLDRVLAGDFDLY